MSDIIVEVLELCFNLLLEKLMDSNFVLFPFLTLLSTVGITAAAIYTYDKVNMAITFLFVFINIVIAVFWYAAVYKRNKKR